VVVRVATRQGGGPSSSAETPASSGLGGGLLGWLPQTSLATTQFSVRGLGPEPAEPPGQFELNSKIHIMHVNMRRLRFKHC